MLTRLAVVDEALVLLPDVSLFQIVPVPKPAVNSWDDNSTESPETLDE
jgi:hypothetical protein